MFEKNTLVRQKALERLYDGVCSIIDQTEIVDEDGISSFEDTVIAENIPCRVSIGSSPVAVQNEDVAVANQTITLFCAPDVPLKKGSQIEVTQYGITSRYKCAGVPAVYDVFQSVEMETGDNGSQC